MQPKHRMLPTFTLRPSLGRTKDTAKGLASQTRAHMHTPALMLIGV